MGTSGKVLIGIVVAVVVLVGAAAIFLTTLGPETLVPPVAAKVKAVTGRDLTVAGDARVVLALPPRVVLTDIAFGNAPWASTPKMIEAQRLDLTVELLPLLRGSVSCRVSHWWVPSIALETDGAGRANWQFETAPGASPAAPRTTARGLPAALVIGNVEVSDGMITYRDGPKSPVTTITVRELALQPRTLAGDLEVRFAGAVGDLPLDVEGRVGPIAAIIARRWPYPGGHRRHRRGPESAVRGQGAGPTARAMPSMTSPWPWAQMPYAARSPWRPAERVPASSSTLPHLRSLSLHCRRLSRCPPRRRLFLPRDSRACIFFPDTPVIFAPLRWADAEGKLAIDSLTLADGREIDDAARAR